MFMNEDWREVTAEWKGELGFIGENKAGASIQMGQLEGRPGISPMEMLLLGMAGCTGIDIVNILTKKRLALQNFQVRVRGKRAEQHPRVYTDIEVIYLLWGDDLDARSVEQAIQLSEEKYCSAGIMLGAVAKIRSSYHIFKMGEKLESDDVFEKYVTK